MENTDKIIKEDENFIWYETKYGVGYVVPKHVFWQLEQKEDEQVKDDR